MRGIRRLAALAVALSITGPARARPPATDAERREAIETLVATFRPRFLEVPEVRPEALLAQLQRGEHPVLVDVRAPEERAVSTLPGAIAPEAVEADPARWQGTPIVAYCTIGYRSSAWALEQRAVGLDVRNLRGGVLAWTHAGGPLHDRSGPTLRVHVYGPAWDLARSDHLASW